MVLFPAPDTPITTSADKFVSGAAGGMMCSEAAGGGAHCRSGGS
jgi:hypothetical protein